jgi:predicted DNA-binding transcriptional regulator YafY
MGNVVTTASSTPAGRTTPQATSLTPAEIAALALSLAHLGAGPQSTAACEALRRLFDNEPREGDPDAEARADLIAVTLATLTTPLEGAVAGRARTIAAAISERLAVRLHYRDAKGIYSVRHVEPVTCLVHKDHWYLVAWCRLRRGIRAFRFDRILAVEPTGSPAPAHPAERFLPFQRRIAA